MHVYAACLLFGTAGLSVMALGGLGAHTHGHGGAHTHGHSGGHHVASSHTALTNHAKEHASLQLQQAPFSLWSLLSPLRIFSLLVGLGAMGILARRWVTEPLAFGLALAGGIVFEKFLVAPLRNFFFRFASAPALTLETSVYGEAQAVTNFDAQGHGLVSIELDGQVVQLLGSLSPDDQAMGVRVRAGDRLRIEEIDSARNQCKVSYLH